jgi:hypothetical protein
MPVRFFYTPFWSSLMDLDELQMEVTELQSDD